jgi:hypothetical protein
VRGSDDSAAGGGGKGGTAYGGGLFNGAGSTTLTRVSLTSNQALGGPGGDGGMGARGGADGSGIGGGLYIASPTASIDATTTFVKNKASTAYDDIFGP